MPNLPDDLSILKDDMVAFVEGHGMRRFPGYVDHEEVQTVMWKPGRMYPNSSAESQNSLCVRL